ncbi:MAG: aminotransferase class III-fold pyridoxal phosphate-dependent enzyme [Hyphomicrobiaceae bacterium]|nr:aminotransferase class III-fold pyridoxal phosphate-dependent enzyme [Hyphomicrobiaceae bacterium]
MSARYARSEQQLERARRTIPLGAQTFSKSLTQFPLGASPYFAARAKGSRVWDVDGNEYIDFANALASVTLGYADPDVNAAVAAQLDDGTIYTLSHALESEVAEMICDLVPSAEMVRFGKNGSDATAGAIRIARAYTGRDHVLTCGYHGWQDWYIGATARSKGVPEATRQLTHTFPYNDLPALDALLAAHDGQVAAIILEPMNVVEPMPGFLEGVKERAVKAGAVLVFDETITGFRFANGGAQELFGVTPDLTTLGKGIANGFPLSAVCGRRDIMMEMEEVFFSFTMGGETLSLAAAKAVLGKLLREPVVETLRRRGQRLVSGVAERIVRHGAQHFLETSGNPTWTFLLIKDAEGVTSWEIKTLWLQEMMARGILTVGTHNMSYAHSEEDVDRALSVYDEVLPIVSDAVRNRAVRQLLKCEPLEPLFRIR